MGNNNNKRKQINKNNNSKNSRNNLDKTDKFKFVSEDDEKFEQTELLDLDFEEEEVIEDNNVVAEIIEVIEDNKDNGEKIELLDDLFRDNKVEWAGKRSVLATCLIVLCAFVLGFSVSLLFSDRNVKVKSVEKVETKIVNDENIVFLGDSIFEMYDVEKYFEGRRVINSGISGHKTTDILNNMQYRVYRYNPSVIFMMIGTNDVLDSNLTNEDTIENVGKIIDEIKKNRPYATINVISIFPVNDTDDEKINHDMVYVRNNKDIKKMNDGIKKICKEKNITFIDMYSLLVDSNDKLKLEYTTEGVHITSSGYEIITKELKKYLDKK